MALHSPKPAALGRTAPRFSPPVLRAEIAGAVFFILLIVVALLF